MSYLDPPDTYHDDVEQHLAREEALLFLRAQLSDLRPTESCSPEPVAILLEWFDELRRSHQEQADRITALLTAVDYLRPPF